MPKKSRKRRAKRRMWMNPQPLAVKEVNQRPQVLPLSPKQAPVAKFSVTMAEYAARHRMCFRSFGEVLPLRQFYLYYLSSYISYFAKAHFWLGHSSCFRFGSFVLTYFRNE